MKRARYNLKFRKTTALLFLVAFEIAFGIYIFNSSKESVSQAYIVKNGASYLLLWKAKDNATIAKNFSYLHQALQFAADELDLQLGPNPNSQATVETVWSRDDLGKRMVYWTTDTFQSPHRLTFTRTWEAEVYNAAFKRGAYTTSPFGHSLSLVPKLSTH